MAQRNNARIDRFAQMSKQEEIIAKKRQEILEKQRTTQLAKAVAAAQSLAAKMKAGSDDAVADDIGNDATGETNNVAVLTTATTATKTTETVAITTPKEILAPTVEKSDVVKVKKDEIVETATPKPFNSLTAKTGKISFGIKRLQPQVHVSEQPPPKVVNSFCNDGSFLENFKKILEKHEPKPPVVVIAESNSSNATTDQPEVTQSSDANANVTSVSMESVVQSSQGPHTAAQTTMVPTVQSTIAQPSMQQTLPQPVMPPMSQPSMPHHHQQSIPPPPHPHVRSLQPPQQPQLQSLPILQPQPPTMQQQPPQTAGLPPPPTQPQFLFNHPTQPPPVPPPHPMSAAFFAAAPPPPPPPQLPLALALGPLYMIPAPEPLQLNTIPAPKEFDLNAIPNPQMNVEAIQVPHGVQQPQQQPQSTSLQQPQQTVQQQQQPQQQHLQNPFNDHISTPIPPQMPPQLQQLQNQLPPQMQHVHKMTPNQQQQPPPPPPPPQLDQQADVSPNNPPQIAVFSDNNDHSCSRIQLPTTVEHLIDLVADNGDGYEDKIRAHKNDLHPAMWFLFEKNCEQYHNYRQQLNERRRKLQQQQHQPQPYQQNQQQQQYPQRLENRDIQEMDEDSSDSDEPQQRQQEKRYLYHQQQRQQQQRCEQLSPHTADQQQEDVTDIYDPESVISGDVDSDDEYMRGMLDRNRDNLKRRIECRNELSEEERQEREAEAEQEERRRQERKKQRKSRWGEKVQPTTSSTANALSNVPTSFANQNKPLLSAVTRNDPALLQYARLNYGSINLSEEDWKKCEEHYKVNLLYQDMMRKRQEIDRLARTGKFKYEYDSDEDVEGGTWEHKLRCAEMEATKLWATALTKQSEGKHHIGDFLPPEELKKFMEQYEAKKNNRQPDLSDYKEYKLKEDNIGFQMLQKLGWKEGQGLGTDGGGIVNPVNKAPQRDGNQGLGVASAASPEECDNEYDAYRKRMMLAYRFRPNPLNNPRRAYY